MDRPNPNPPTFGLGRRTWCTPWLALCCVAAVAGCAGRGAAERDLYQRELRLQEDEIYRLEDCIEEYQCLVRRYRTENESLKSYAGTPGGSTPSVEKLDSEPQQRSLLDDRPSPGGQGPNSRPPQRTKAPEIELPEIDMGEPVPAPRVPKPAPSAAPGPVEIPGGAEMLEAPPFQSNVADPPSAPLSDAALFTEHGTPDHRGMPTMMAFVEPLSRGGRPASFAGGVSLLLMDPSLPKERRDIARWDFTQEEVERAWRNPSRRVLDLPLALESPVADDRRLELWVRLVDADGHKAIGRTTLHMPAPVTVLRAEDRPGQLAGAVMLDDSWAVATAQAPKAAGPPRPFESVAQAPASWKTSAAPRPPSVSGRQDQRIRQAEHASAPAAWSPNR
ncbi:hypothetical protein Pla175_45970 [Pirellulimonas nuda]|uniref:Uncharacterized protein n=1 Tax=Pirellulimonas nuda TaxID=2528009 RepID=A0A518DI69_9BACT|nr:hypothetical protein [Pirellulimonas nuda]QDU91177.1 hypothetical protein Pla175_45970 [Pirellulimonas nuda]